MPERFFTVGDDFKTPPQVKGGAGFDGAYVRFVDLNGNPITARTVVIKVDTATWEINDIVAEA